MSTPKKFRQAEKIYSQALEYNEQGNWGFSEQEFLKALILYAGLKAFEKVAACHYSIGNVCFNKGNLEETKKHWLEAYEVYKRSGNLSEAAGVSIDLGDLMYDMNVSRQSARGPRLPANRISLDFLSQRTSTVRAITIPRRSNYLIKHPWATTKVSDSFI